MSTRIASEAKNNEAEAVLELEAKVIKMWLFLTYLFLSVVHQQSWDTRMNTGWHEAYRLVVKVTIIEVWGVTKH